MLRLFNPDDPQPTPTSLVDELANEFVAEISARDPSYGRAMQEVLAKFTEYVHIQLRIRPILQCDAYQDAGQPMDVLVLRKDRDWVGLLGPASSDGPGAA